MNEFFDGFADILSGVHWPSLTPYELGEYAAAGSIGALCGMLLMGVVLLIGVSYDKAKEKVKDD